MYADTLLYNYEACQRWQSLPGEHYAPQLYIDGHRHGGWSAQWEDSIVYRMNKISPIFITMDGTYNVENGQGVISARFRNDSTAEIHGRVMFVIVEDSIYFMDSLGGQMKEWHNHTARDYIPGPYGEMITVAAGDSVIYTQPFAIPSAWQYEYCSIITFIQDTVLQPDTVSQYIRQGCIIKVTDLIGINENLNTKNISNMVSKVSPNPCTDRTEIHFRLNAGTAYRITLYDITGRLVKTFSGISQSRQGSVLWDCRDEQNNKVCSGVYIYYLQSRGHKASGLIVIDR
jgi:hypothetical protein